MSDSTVDRSNEVPIPQPPEHMFGLLGNLPDIDPSFFLGSIWRLHDLYGEIFQLNLVARRTYVVNTWELAKDVTDDAKFEKKISGALENLRPAIKDGLFSAYPGEPNWGKVSDDWHANLLNRSIDSVIQAHRLLMAIFGPLSVRKMFPEMKTIALQMLDRWDRMGEGYEIAASDDFTRLAFDTIGKCGMGYNFYQFFQDHVHPFATQMADTLTEAGRSSSRTQLENMIRYKSALQTKENITAMHKLVDEIIADRKAKPQPNRHDLLNVMLYEKDPVTGDKLLDENIRYQLLTFLIAGHETTSGTLSFLMYHLLNAPEKMMKAIEEVDRVLGMDDIDVKHVPQLKYIDACIKETLRFQGPIGVLNRSPREDIMLGGRYFIPKGASVSTSLHGLHHDPAVWGDDHDQFKPERMLDLSKVPAGAWKPFGTGERSCIGRAFAEQEMVAAVALMLQRYQIVPADPNYQLHLKATLTIKPDNFRFKAMKRPGWSEGHVAKSTPSAQTSDSATGQVGAATSSDVAQSGPTINVYYGSNAGTCKSFAEEVQAAAPGFGFSAKIKTLDEAVEAIPTEGPCVIITSSYEGKAPDNARKFVAWLEANKGKSGFLKGVKFSVFGVGNPEWVTTYQRIPKLIDELMVAADASRICDSVFADIKETAIGDFEIWLEHFKSSLGSLATSKSVKTLKTSVIKSGTPGVLGQSEMSYGIVRENRLLADDSVGPFKRHTAIELPLGSTYSSGDYLVVLPYNHPETVSRVLRRFDMHADDILAISDTNKAHLQTDIPKSAHEFFSTRVELNNIATQRQIDAIIASTPEGADKKSLQSLSENYKAEVQTKRASVLDIIEDHPAAMLELSEFLEMLKPLTPRQYSISSSPLVHLSSGQSETKGPIATVTYDVHSAPAFSGHGRTFNGVASSYLARQAVGSRIRCFVRQTNAAFRLPSDLKTPVVLVAAGSGLAPMRGFLEERAALAEARGVDALGPATFYFGCRDFEKDYIYKEELAAWEAKGIVKMRPAFSKRGPAGGKTHKYVPDRVWEEREEVQELFKSGAKIFLCGSAGKLAKSTADTVKKIWRELHPEADDAAADAWFESIKETRYVSDVFD